ncbi:hypothetical protein ABIB73_000798 [Bradyrhizobium sp. F1.4.3]|uniref:WD40/YVTN/BNR-like repeat-containing protein n=1 Tax=Bradyrhizobium sp. F1.4.3 TaxID=3156356 RepID=UPI0033956183
MLTRRNFILAAIVEMGWFPLVSPAVAALAWKPLKVGGGGFTRDHDIAPDGTRVCKVDVFGAYILNKSLPSTGNAGGMGLWQQLFAPGRIPLGDPAYSPATRGRFFDSMGAWDVRIAPSNSDVIYMMECGMMYKSINKGLNFVNQTDNAGGTFPLQSLSNCNPNSPAGGPGPAMAIDDQNPDHVWVGTFAGIWSTVDGGSHWTKINASKLPLPTGGTYVCGFAFDPVSAIVGGLRQGIYVWIYGHGVYHTSDAGANWTALTGSPTNCVRIVVDKFGVAWVCADAKPPNVWNFTVQSGTLFTPNTWTNSAGVTTYSTWSVAPDPTSTTSATQRVIIAGVNGGLAQTLDGGQRWTPAQSEQFNQVATDAPWLQTDERFMSMNGCMKFDPSISNTLCFPEGIGYWEANLPSIGNSGSWGAWTWNSRAAGIESLETTQIISPPGGGIGLVQWDRPWFLITDKSKFPSSYGIWPGGRANKHLGQSVIFGGNGADWAASNPNFIALLCAGSGGSTAGQQTGPGYTTNGGVPVTGWNFFANQPPGLNTGSGSAAMAVSSPTSMMVAASSGVFATTDGGATPWVDATPAGSRGWGNGFSQINQNLAADKVTANYYVGYSANKIFWTANTGGAWNTVASPGLSFGGSNGSGVQLKAIPNNAGHYFITGGGSFGARVDNTNKFSRSNDGGRTWHDVSQAGYTVREVYVWGYGKAVGRYPTIFIYGYVNSVLGVWKTEDDCVSWTKIGDATFGGMTFDNPNCMAGDMNQAGVVYVGFLGSGYLQFG